MLPRTSTNEKGEYRFQNVPWWGRYTVYAEDEDKGYSSFSAGPLGDTNPPEVAITPEHREAELNVQLPPRAGFVPLERGAECGGDAGCADAVREARLAAVHDELLFKPCCVGAAGQEPFVARDVGRISRVGRECRRGKAP